MQDGKAQHADTPAVGHAAGLFAEELLFGVAGGGDQVKPDAAPHNGGEKPSGQYNREHND